MRSYLFPLSSLLVALGVTILVTSCDIIPEGQYYAYTLSDSVTVDPNPDPTPEVTGVKKVLLEEFTGHECGNCPEASEKAYKLVHETLPNNTVLVVIHAGNLAEPAPAGSGKYEVDYRIAAGEELYTYYKLAAVPYGLVGRAKRPGKSYYYFPENEWESQTRTQLGKNLDTLPDVRLLLDGSYDAATRTFSGKVNIKYNVDAADPAGEQLSLYLVEDSVVSWQKDYRLSPDEDIPNYVHHNMLRQTLNGTFGQPIRSGGQPIKAGNLFYRTVSFTVPAGYRANHCKLVAFVHNKNTRQVRQVEARYLYE